MKDTIKKLLSDISNGEILDDEFVISKEIDSYKMMELICGLENCFGIELSPEDISELNNSRGLEDIVNIIEKNYEI